MRRAQNGYVLYMALILLLGVTILAVIAMRSTASEEIMARGQRDLARAFESAETQIINAEQSLDPTRPTAEVNCQTIDSEAWALAQTAPGFDAQRIDPCDGSSSLAMGGISTQKTDLKYRILATDFDDPQRRGSQVAIETIYIP
jgi:hypothetical protein